MRGRVLIVAGSDSGGGAGIQADIKTVAMLDGYATTAISALTAQNTLGVSGIFEVSPEFVARQMEAVLTDIGADAIKTGMLANAAIVAVVADMLERFAPEIPLVIDPVMIAKGGQSLLAGSSHDILRRRLIPRAALITPNLPEAEALTGLAVSTPRDMEKAGRALLAMGAGAVLVKGGHLEGDDLVDLLVTATGVEAFPGRRIETRSTHGTGCTLASAIATGLAQGMALRTAVARGIDYVRRAIASAPGLGQGHGPLDHSHPLRLVPDK